MGRRRGEERGGKGDEGRRTCDGSGDAEEREWSRRAILDGRGRSEDEEAVKERWEKKGEAAERGAASKRPRSAPAGGARRDTRHSAPWSMSCGEDERGGEATSGGERGTRLRGGAGGPRGAGKR